MIKSNELRRGNSLKLIWENGGPEEKFIKVFGIFEDTLMYPMDNQDGAYYPESLKQFEPIPLTPEILEKAGFKADEEFKEGVLSWEKDGIELLTVGMKDNKGHHIPYFGVVYNGARKPLSFVHELQNFWFWFTGEELKIDL